MNTTLETSIMSMVPCITINEKCGHSKQTLESFKTIIMGNFSEFKFVKKTINEFLIEYNKIEDAITRRLIIGTYIMVLQSFNNNSDRTVASYMGFMNEDKVLRLAMIYWGIQREYCNDTEKCNNAILEYINKLIKVLHANVSMV